MLERITRIFHNNRSSRIAKHGVVVHGVTEGENFVSLKTIVLPNLLKTRCLVDPAWHHVNPRITRWHKRETLSQLALKNHGHVHGFDTSIAANRSLNDTDVRRGRIEHALRIWKIFVKLTHECGIVIQKIGVIAVIYHKMHAIKFLGECKELLDGGRGKHLTIEHDIIGVHLRAKRRNVIYLMSNRLKHPAQSIVAATGRSHKVDALLAKCMNEFKRLRRDISILIKKRTVHV